MARKLTRAAALQNRAFLRILARTGNVRLAAREVGVAHSTLLTRRRKHPGFAQRWDAALVLAQARLGGWEDTPANALAAAPVAAQLKGAAGPLGYKYRKRDASPLHQRNRTVSKRSDLADPLPLMGEGKAVGSRKTPFDKLRTNGGEAHYCRRADGRVQVRRAIAGRLTRAAEQAFLSALSATCNVRLSAAAVGASPRAFYRRQRSDPAFAREMRLALARGYERIELALLEAGLAGAHEQDDWRHNDPPALPPMSVNQGLQLMYLHQKSVLLKKEQWPVKKRRGESSWAYSLRLNAMAELEQQARRDAFDFAEAERFARGEAAMGALGEKVRDELGLPDDGSDRLLPDLAQVTGWSRAREDAEVADPGRALFGGRRTDELEQWLEREGDGWVWRVDEGEGAGEGD